MGEAARAWLLADRVRAFAMYADGSSWSTFELSRPALPVSSPAVRRTSGGSARTDR